MSNPRDAARLDNLLARLLGFPKVDREAKLEALCEDLEMREEIRALLNDRQRLRRYLEQVDEEAKTEVALDRQLGEDLEAETLVEGSVSPEHVTSDLSTSELATSLGLRPEAIGPYSILDVLGQGGMGVVYLAEQTEPVQRKLAVKLVHLSLGDPVAAARFEAERQAMARLSHPNIAQIFEAGTTVDGFPYFAMEYVRGGVPITKYCDAKRATLEERLRLFLSVCRGVQHAHQRGIIHRDLKPSNLLVTEEQGESVVKIIDFGLAKALDQPLTDERQLTQGHLVGTPEYMGPELFETSKHRADLDTRSDVYSLGIILYELFCGRRPFEVQEMNLMAMLQYLATHEPPTPSRRLLTSSRLSSADVAERRQTRESILHRQLKGDLDFVVMKAIARDREERYDSVAELAADLERYLRQQPVEAHPPSRAYRIKKFMRRHRTAVVSACLVLLALVLGTIGTATGMLRANREAEVARKALGEAEELAGFLTDLFRTSEPGNPAQEMTAREILDAGAKTIATGLEDQPQAKARILTTIGEIYTHLALYDQAEDLLEESLELHEGSLGGPNAAEALHAFGILRYRQDHYEEAEKYLSEALEFFRLTGDLRQVAKAAESLGSVLKSRGNYMRADALLRESLATHRRAFGEDHLETVDAYNSLGVLALSQERYAEGEDLILRALEISEKQPFRESPGLTRSLRNLAEIYRAQGRWDESLGILERVLAAQQKIYDETHPTVAQVYGEIAVHFDEKGEFERAEEYHRRALGVYAARGEESLDLAVALNNFGTFYWESSDYENAEIFYLRSLQIKEKFLDSDHGSLAHSFNNLGLIYWKQGRFEDAETFLRRALEVWETRYGAEHSLVAWPLWGLAGVYRDQGRFSDAEPLYRRALEIREKVLPADHRDLRNTRVDYAALLRATGREALAIELEAKSHVANP